MSVSVVIPTFNRGEKVRATLDSIVAQTRAPLEIIVVDDGSRDGTPDWIEAHYGASVRVIRVANGGVARARNRGLRESSGEWIAFCDHDDVWHRRKLERLLGAAREETPVVVCRWREVDEQGMVARESPSVAARDAFGWLFGWHNPLVSMSVPLVRRSALLGVGGFDARCAPADDWDLWLRLARGASWAWVDEVLVDYHLHANQQRLDQRRMFRAVRRVLGKHPLQLARRPLLGWWLAWSSAFVPSIPAYERAQNGEFNGYLEALARHPLALLSPQWLALMMRQLARR